MIASKTYAAARRKAKAPGRRRPLSTSHDLTIFEPRLLAVMPQAVAKELVNTMRSILKLGGRKQRLLEMRRQKIKELLQELGDNEAIRVYNEFATAHDQVEERLTSKLPLIEELEGGGDEVNQDEDDSDYYSAQEELEGEEAVADDATDEESGIELIKDTGVEMEDVPSATSQVSATPDVDTGISPCSSPHEAHAPFVMREGVACDKHIGDNCTVVPIQNAEAFPLTSIQEVQAEFYPSTRILDMQIHHDQDYHITQVTATLDKGPVDQLIINDPRIVTFLGLRQPPYATICLQPNPRINETYQIHIQPGQNPRNAKAWIVGELMSARHAYLYWLDIRQTADPRAPPTIAEVRLLAPKIGRRAGDIWREIEKVWDLEQGSGGRHFRENRMKYFGEDPVYGAGEEKRSRRSMWV
ncbi:hypothetical protein ACET3X_007877 [Alternaria dauci]|uniref:Uncharacterized protein n=1 Tax=Alternaria dauci TaxID=48095 RepID=A0ABR3UD76_9PLEO